MKSTQTPHELWYGETPSVKYFKILEANAILKIMMKILASLNLEQMKAFSLVILPIEKHISVKIK